jgi:hypothetical protein
MKKLLSNITAIANACELVADSMPQKLRPGMQAIVDELFGAVAIAKSREQPDTKSLRVALAALRRIKRVNSMPWDENREIAQRALKRIQKLQETGK